MEVSGEVHESLGLNWMRGSVFRIELSRFEHVSD